MIFPLVLVVFAAVLLIFYKNGSRRTYAEIERIPGPPAKPLIGNALDLGTNTVDILKNLKALVKRYGSIVRLWVGPNLFILLTEASYLGKLLLSSDQHKSKMYGIAKSIFGQGLVTSEGEKWKKDRRMLAPCFNTKVVEGFMAVFNRNTDEMVTHIKNSATLDYVDVTDYVWRCGFNAICDSTMQVDIKGEKEYLKAVTWMMANITSRNFSILKRFDFFYRFTSAYRTEEKMRRILDDFTDSIIAARRKQRLTEVPDQTTFLDHLLNMSDDDPSFTDENIRDQVKTIIVAGSDTVVSSVSFGIFELAKHPDIQRKILEEIRVVVGDDKKVALTFENVEALKYTECVFKEILRMYGPVPAFERLVKTEMRFGDYTIPADTTIIIFTAGMNCDERYFPEPMKFDPDRFLPENVHKIPAQAYMPLGAGPRICIGQKYGTVEAKVMLAKLVQNFEIVEVQPRHEIVYSMEVTLKSASGLPVRLKIR